MGVAHPVSAVNQRLQAKAFTLVELLVVMVIISLLLAIMLPSLSAARQAALSVQCASNMRQICAALNGYAAENYGKYPLNMTIPFPGKCWCDPERLGRWFPGSVVVGKTTMANGVLACPADPDGVRSYSMNVWASSNNPSATASKQPGPGVYWTPATVRADRFILLVEAWSTSSYAGLAGGYAAPSAVGGRGQTAGERFGGGPSGAGIQPPFSILPPRFPTGLVCELDYSRHRNIRGMQMVMPVGKINIGYADGHVSMRSNTDLVNPSTGASTLDSWWSPLDPQMP